VRQREHKREQLDEMFRFAEAHGCRMLHLLRHFGDQEDRTRPCGGATPAPRQETVVRRWRPPTPRETERIARVLEALRQRDRQATGQVHRAVLDAVPERRDLEKLLDGLVRGGLVRLSPDTFEKDGRTISFQRAALTPGRTAAPGDRGRAARGRRSPRLRRPHGGHGRRPPRAAPEAAPEATPGESRVPRSRARRHGRVTGAGGTDPCVAARRGPAPAHPRVPHLRRQNPLPLAEARPEDEGALLAVPGLGPKLAQRYGELSWKLVASATSEGAAREG
jgi:DNA topoisomerase-3